MMREALHRLNEEFLAFKDRVERIQRILVIDDEEVICSFFEEFLRDAGYDVITAVSGGDGIAALKKGGINLVISDKNLPDISGIEVLRMAKKIRPEVEVMILTGYASIESALQAIDLGAYDYLIKPIDNLQVIKGKIKRALRKQTRTLLQRKMIEGLSGLLKEIMKTRGTEAGKAIARLEDELRKFKGNLGKGRILLAEDEEPTRTAIEKFLSAEGYETCIARSIAEGMDILRIDGVGLVLSDMGVEGMPGIEIIKMGKAIDPFIEGIIIGHITSLDDLLMMVEDGAYDFILKPIEGLDVLRRKVKRAMRERISNMKHRKLVQELKALSKEFLHVKGRNFFEEMDGYEGASLQRPRSEQPEEPAPSLLKESDEPATTEMKDSMKVLVVDDEDIVCEFMTEILGELGCRVSVAKSGEEGIEAFHRDAHDVIIVDKNLPGISGLDVIRRAKEIDPNVEAIIITGYASLESARLAVSLGVAGYLLKPFESLDKVREAIQFSLKRRAEKERQKKLLEEQVERMKTLENKYRELREELERIHRGR